MQKSVTLHQSDSLQRLPIPDEMTAAARRPTRELSRVFGTPDGVRVMVEPLDKTHLPDIARVTLHEFAADSDWEAEAVMTLVKGRLVIRTLTIEPTRFVGKARKSHRRSKSETPRRGVTSDALRAFPYERFMTAVRDRLENLPDMLAWRRYASDVQRSPETAPSPGEVVRASAAAKSVGQSQQRRGGRGYAESHYREVARCYLELQTSWGRGIRAEMARRFDVTEDTIHNWIKKAVALELISSGQPGRVGRQPGPRF